MARLNRFQTPPQFTLSFSELEWLAYKAACSRAQQNKAWQQSAAPCINDAGCSKKGPDASTLGP